MALNSSLLSDTLKAAFLAAPEESAAVDNQALQAFCDAIAQTVVAHITANAVVTVNPGIAVTTALSTGATSAPGTGTIA